jgi:secreted trypsin-like serine protease
MRRLAALFAGIFICWSAVGAVSAAARARPRIVGGNEASITAFPFQVALYDPLLELEPGKFANLFESQFCGGVILDATHVITAAHCVFNESTGQASSPAEIEVLAGTSNLAEPEVEGAKEGVDYTIDRVRTTSFDPAWSPASGNRDLGVLTLENPLWPGPAPPPLDGKSKIAPIRLDKSMPTLPAFATVSGWGYTDPLIGETQPSGSGFSPILRSAQLSLIAPSQCSEEYERIGQSIGTEMLCAGRSSAPFADACYGDSGGPLVVDVGGAKEPEDYELLGMVDLGHGCAQEGFPGIYQSVVDPANALFLESEPSQAPLLGATAPSISGAPRPGQTLTCDPGSWSDEPTSFEYEFFTDESTVLNPAAVAALTPGLLAQAAYTVQSADAGKRVFCIVRALNSGGYADAISSEVTVETAAAQSSPSSPPSVATPAPDVPLKPTLRVLSKHCAHRRCTVDVLASEAAGGPGVRTVQAVLSSRERVACPKHSKRARCARTVIRKPRVSALSPGGHFVVIATGLRPGSYALTLNAVDKAGVRQPTSTKLTLVLAPVKRRSRRF